MKNSVHRPHSITLYCVVQVLFAPSSNGSTCVRKSMVSLCVLLFYRHFTF